ncbi:hypothetical protein BH10BAC1_BH10BAC1_18510 [soil metagenome]
MKKTLLLFAVFYVSTTNAQSISPEVIATSGTTFSDGTNTLDWTLGEPATNTFNAGSDMLTQGFHQPELMVTAIETLEPASLSVFPNPTISSLNVQFATQQNVCKVELFTMEGKLLESKIYNNTALSVIDMHDYTAGNYLLYITDNNKKCSSFKIIKTN